MPPCAICCPQEPLPVNHGSVALRCGAQEGGKHARQRVRTLCVQHARARSRASSHDLRLKQNMEPSRYTSQICAPAPVPGAK